MRNKGDSFYCVLTIKVNGTDITQTQYPEIELQINPQYENYAIKKLLSTGELVWDSTNSKFKVYLSQTDTFKMLEINNCDIRLYSANSSDANQPYVVSGHATATLNLGDVLSRKVLENNE